MALRFQLSFTNERSMLLVESPSLFCVYTACVGGLGMRITTAVGASDPTKPKNHDVYHIATGSLRDSTRPARIWFEGGLGCAHVISLDVATSKRFHYNILHHSRPPSSIKTKRAKCNSANERLRKDQCLLPFGADNSQDSRHILRI